MSDASTVARDNLAPPGNHFSFSKQELHALCTINFDRGGSAIRLHSGGTKPISGTLQEGGAPFQTTHWTVVLQASKADSDESRRKALSSFAEAYWPPLYTFVRRRGYSSADAQALVQAFFAYLL